MTPRSLRAALLAGAIGLSCAAPALAQLEANLGALTPENAKEYLGPLPKALNTTLNSAMFQTGSIPLAGFNLTIGIHAMAVGFDDEDRTYSPTDPPGFTSTAPVEAPTVIGSTQAVAQPGQGGTTLYHPGGFDVDQFEIGVPQLTIGSVLGTRAVVRWVAFDVGDVELSDVSLWGVGVQHSISRYFKDLPVDLAVGGMYQSFKLGDDAVAGDDALIDTKAFHAELTASRKLALWIQPYAAVGYDQLKMDVHYDQDIGGGQTQRVDVDFDNETSAHFTLGVLLGFPIVKIHAQFDAGSEIGGAVGFRFGLGG